MSRFKLYIEYEGTRYSGWQRQQNSKTVQGVLLKTAGIIFKGLSVDLQGSGRTDSGVHAICQTAHLDVNTSLTPEIIKMKFNDDLPHDINILKVERANKKFHARHDAVSRSYVYQISKRRTAFGKNYVWWIKDRLNFQAMEKASKTFIGMNDFASFADKDKEEKSTIVHLQNIQLIETDELILMRITGSHFLRKMVRRMVGVLVEIGRGKMSPRDISYFLNNYSNKPAQYTAPPSGLFLEQVLYKNDIFRSELLPLITLNWEYKRVNY